MAMMILLLGNLKIFKLKIFFENLILIVYGFNPMI